MAQLKAGDTIRLTGTAWDDHIVDTKEQKSVTLRLRVYEVYLNVTFNTLCFDDEEDELWCVNDVGEGYEFEVVVDKATPTPLQPNDLIELTGDTWEDNTVTLGNNPDDVKVMLGRTYNVRLDEHGDFYFIDEDGCQWDNLEYYRDDEEMRGFKVIETQTHKQGEVMRPEERKEGHLEEKDENAWSEADGFCEVLQVVFAKLGEEAPNPDTLRAYIEGALNARGYDVVVEVEE